MRVLIAVCGLIAAGCNGSVTTSCDPVGDFQPICGLQAPEDLARIPWTRWLLISQMPVVREDEGSLPGSLAALHLDDGRIVQLYPHEAADEPQAGWGDPQCTGSPSASFAPHGIDLYGSRLLVVGHGAREAVEWFEVVATADPPRLIWRGCIIAPDDASLNDVTALPDGGFVATKMFERSHGMGTTLKNLAVAALGRDTGHVLAWSASSGWEHVPGSEGAGPNGIAASPDGQTLFFSAFMDQAVVRIARDGSGRVAIPLEFKPDNLTWTTRGTLLAAGARGSLLDVMRCGSVTHGACRAPFAVAEIDPAAATAREIVTSDGSAGGAVSVALEADGALYLGAFSGERLLRVRRGS